MTHQWDEFSKSLAEAALPRRDSLRFLGAMLAGAVFSPLGLGTAWAAGPDPCKAFCRCGNKKQQQSCLAACRACNNDTSSLCGSCAGGYACTDLSSDVSNCGACQHACEPPGPHEHGACLDGDCVYACERGAVYCDGACTAVLSDPMNCGKCGTVCGGATPNCNQGVCSWCPNGFTLCGGVCVNLNFDTQNCGACGVVCAADETCSGSCIPSESFDPFGTY